jgi:hypothetical protein
MVAINTYVINQTLPLMLGKWQEPSLIAKSEVPRTRMAQIGKCFLSKYRARPGKKGDYYMASKSLAAINNNWGDHKEEGRFQLKLTQVAKKWLIPKDDSSIQNYSSIWHHILICKHQIHREKRLKIEILLVSMQSFWNSSSKTFSSRVSAIVFLGSYWGTKQLHRVRIGHLKD